LVFDAIERIEISIRTQIIYQYSIEYGFFFYQREELSTDPEIFKKVSESLQSEIDRSHEIFLRHFKDKYSEESYPPSIMALEVSSFGTLSKMFRNFKMCDAKKRVGQYFGLNPYLLESWMQSTTYIRNIVAHHGRLWNRKITSKPTLLKTVPKDKLWISSNDIAPNKLYSFLVCVMYLKQTINPGTTFSKRLKDLIARHPIVDTSDMGFPVNWEKEEIWK
jgi:abortive infection bacteriophage resistance protein